MNTVFGKEIFGNASGNNQQGGALAGIEPVSAGINAALGIATTIQGIKDTRQAKEYQKAINNLSYEDQKKLNLKLLQASTQNERLKIMGDSVAAIKAAQVVQAEKNKTTRILIFLGGGLAILLTALIVKRA